MVTTWDIYVIRVNLFAYAAVPLKKLDYNKNFFITFKTNLLIKLNKIILNSTGLTHKGIADHLVRNST